ncbi:MAG: response regulator [Mucilaginibacter sp.]
MKKLIFIDDSPLDHFILKRILNKYQLAYEVNCTASGEEVIEYLEHHKKDRNSLPDIILLDLYMPEFDGWKFLDKVQHIFPALAKPLSIYILSSSINPQDIQLAKQYACVKSFVFKPITKEVLEKLINGEVSKIV